MKHAGLKRVYVIAGAALVFSAIAGTLGYLSRSYIGQVSNDFVVANPSATSTLPDSPVRYELVGAVRSEPQSFRQVLLSSPLIIFQRSLSVQFSIRDVFEETNRMRVETGIEPLSLNRELTLAAEQKVADMFERQYFEHQTPEGNGPELFVKNAGYEYVSIGENLALGDFGSEKELVMAWMNSPGHRENILRTQFQEVGVAIGRGMYEGKYVTIAVQHFGRPLSSCPAINYVMRADIDMLRARLTSIGINIDTTNESIQRLKRQDPQNTSELERSIREYNAAVDEYNTIIESIKTKTVDYNVSVNQFNDCLKILRNMTITEAIFLGIVEGVTEFLPVSSTGHLIVASRLLGIETTEFLKTFQIVIQAGAILAVLPLFIRRAIKSPKKIGHIFAAFIPTAVVGVIVYPFVKGFFDYPSLVAWSLLIGGIVILLVEYRVKHKREQNPDFVMKKSISLKQAMILGVYQTIAFIPGVSRSGSTIVGGLLQGIDRRAIVEFSFLLSVPTIIAASGYDLLQTQAFFSGTNIILLIIGFISSWISATICITVFLRFVATHTFIAFGWYRIVAGGILLLFFF